jgi:hypothetical protein
MPWRIVHLVENHLALTPLWGKFTLDELHQYDAVAIASLKFVDLPLIHTIYDCTALESLPPLLEMSRLQAARHPKIGWVIFVGVQNDMLRFMFSMTTQLFRQRLRFMESHAEALRFIAEVDTTLPDLCAFDIPAIVAQLKVGQVPPGIHYIGP